MEVLEGFKEYLRNQLGLSELSIALYMRTVKRFLLKYKDPTIENINKFIIESAKNKTSYYTKFVFKHFLKYLGREQDYLKLVKVKQKSPMKRGVYLNKDELKQIIFSIPDETYRMVALIQYATGLRAGDVLRIRKENVEWVGDMLRITLVQKGGNVSTIFLFEPYASMVWEFVQKSKEYPFLKGKNSSFERWVSNNYVYYWKVLKQAAKKLGYDKFSTHDFRRNFAQDVFRTEQDIRKVQIALRHKNISTTIRYLERIQEEEVYKDVVRKIRD